MVGRGLRRIWVKCAEFFLGVLIIVFFIIRFALIWAAAVLMIPFHIVMFAIVGVGALFGAEFEPWDPVPEGFVQFLDRLGSRTFDGLQRLLRIENE